MVNLDFSLEFRECPQNIENNMELSTLHYLMQHHAENK